MNDLETALSEQQPARPHCVFGLIVTGKGERDFLPSLFSSLLKKGTFGEFRFMPPSPLAGTSSQTN
jgi:hypothetical protein